MTCKQCEKKDKRIEELRDTVKIAAERIIKVNRQNRALQRENQELKAPRSLLRRECESVGI